MNNAIMSLCIQMNLLSLVADGSDGKRTALQSRITNVSFEVLSTAIDVLVRKRVSLWQYN